MKNDHFPKLIIFHHISLANLPVALFKKLFGNRVLFIDLVGTLKSLHWVSVLQRVGIEWIDYSNYTQFEVSAHIKVQSEYADLIFRAEIGNDIAVKMSSQNEDLGITSLNLRPLIYDSIYLYLGASNELYALAEYFNEQGYKSAIYQPRKVIHGLVERHIGIKNKSIQILNIGWMVYFLRILIAIFFTIGVFFKRQESDPETHNAPVSTGSKVLFFPHKGISPSNITEDDQYYDADPESPLHKTKIQHVELMTAISPSEMPSLLSNYQSHGIKAAFVKSERASFSRLIEILNTLFRAFPKVVLSNEIAICASLTISRIEVFKTAFEPYKNSQIAILGYDSLFPKAAIIALQSFGIKVVACQERISHIYMKFGVPILDTYFTHGNIVNDLVKRNPYSYVKKLVISGDPKKEKISKFSSAAKQEKHVKYSSYKKVCLVFDYHSQTDPFKNAKNLATSWSSNALFYHAIECLAQGHPNTMFIIRGKNNDWLEIPALENTKKAFEKLENVLIDDNHDIVDRAYILAAMADIVVARYTSLVDQCLAEEIPVLVYEPTANGSPAISSFHNYQPYPIMSYTEDDLLERFRAIVDDNRFMDKELFEEMRKNYYEVPGNGQVSSQIILTELKSMIQD